MGGCWFLGGTGSNGASVRLGIPGHPRLTERSLPFSPPWQRLAELRKAEAGGRRESGPSARIV